MNKIFFKLELGKESIWYSPTGHISDDVKLVPMLINFRRQIDSCTSAHKDLLIAFETVVKEI